MRILVSAYACGPSWGSEIGMGWNWIVNLAEFNEVFVITEGEFKNDIENSLKNLRHDRICIYYLPVSEGVRKMCWNQGDWRFYFHYRKWQKRTVSLAKKIIRENDIEIIHHLNMVGFREPGYLWMLPVPFVLGPIGGYNLLDYRLLKGLKVKEHIFLRVKFLLSFIQFSFSPRFLLAIRKASLVIAATKEMGVNLRRVHEIDPVVINETGCNTDEVTRVGDFHSEFLDVLWVGRFINTKNLTVALNTFLQLRNSDKIRLHVIGADENGSTESEENYVKSVGLINVFFYGRKSNDFVQEKMKRCDLFFFTSTIEATSTVILESIQNKLPILCFNTCGFADIVDDKIGVKIDVIDLRQSPKVFADEIRSLYEDRQKLVYFSSNCREKQLKNTWFEKAKLVTEFYKKILRER